MRKMVLLLSSLLWVTAYSVYAQTPPPGAPWPPDPEIVFAEHVNWQLVDNVLSTTGSTHEPILDPEVRIIRVYVPSIQTWQEYAYPDQAETVYDARVRSDGLILVKVADSLGFDSARLAPEDYLLLDPASGTYTDPPAVCQHRRLQDAPGEGHWQVIEWYENETHRAFLCHSETGEEHDILPSDFVYGDISVSPNGAWLVLVGYLAGEGKYHTFAYHPETDTLRSLGIVNRSYESKGFGYWVSNEKGTLCLSHSWSWTPSQCYTFDVTHPNSIEYAFSAWRNNLIFTDEPPRYLSLMTHKFWASMAGGSGPEHIPCGLTIYDADGVRWHDLAYECLPIALEEQSFEIALRHGNNFYYLATTNEKATVSELRRFDFETETGSTALFTGEIESILSVSPDQQYVVLLMDDNGVLDNLFETCCRERGGWQVVIFDQNRGTLVYHSEPIGVYMPGQVVWTASNTVVIGTLPERGPIKVSDNDDLRYLFNPPSLRRITLNDNFTQDIYITTQFGMSRTYPISSLLVAPDKRYVILGNTVIDLLTLQRIPVLRDTLPEDYNISLSWAEDGALVTKITSQDSAGARIVYRISVVEEGT